MAVVNESTATSQITLEPQSPPLTWKRWPLTGPIQIHYCEAEVTSLAVRRTYAFTMRAGGNPVAAATVTTLPNELPTLGEKPFTVLLGSCFAYHEDKQLKVGNTFFHLPHQAKPDIKFLAGDQVYLDSPWHWYAIPRSGQQLRDAFLEHYVNTWSQKDGFVRLLSDGANFFSSDDHEFWNNAPNRGSLWVNTWTKDGRTEWFAAASELYRVFQTPKSIMQFSVRPVSFFIADTRMNRDENWNNFMTPADLDELGKWVKTLRGPGVLVIGQPLLQKATSYFKGTFGDWNLPDFKQYERLVDALANSEHSLVVLTGDVHFGRIARSSLRAGGELIEIISSPMSLVDPNVRGTWAKAPDTFPSTRPADTTPAALAKTGIVTEADFAPTEGHFLTLEFTRRGTGANLRVRFWPVFEGGVPSPTFGKAVWERVLQ
jgi:hypothetical protein